MYSNQTKVNQVKCQEFELAPESDEEGVSKDDMQQHCTDAQPQMTEGTEADNPTTSQEPKRGRRFHKLTEKGPRTVR